MSSRLITLLDLVLNKGWEFPRQLELAAIQCRMMLRVNRMHIHVQNQFRYMALTWYSKNRQTSLLPGFEELGFIAAPVPAEC